MEFDSIEELVRYVENKQAAEMHKVGEEMKNIMKEETKRQVDSYHNIEYQNTGDIIDCIDTTMISKNSVEVSWQDNGGWYSVSDKTYRNHFYAPFGLENGTTWGEGSSPSYPKYRPQTNFIDESMDQIERDLPKQYKRIMNGLGIPLK